MAILNKHFINCWFLIKELNNSQSNQFILPFVSTLVKEYRFPVESVIVFPNGTRLNRINANELLKIDDFKQDQSSSEIASSSSSSSSLFSGLFDFEDSLDAMYENFLRESLKKAGLL